MKILFALLSLVFGSATAFASDAVLSSYQSQFCDGTYALCIKAKCSPIPSMERLGNYSVDKALCVCDVVKGINMGPGSCEDRALRSPKVKAGVPPQSFLISTYSNRYNNTTKTLHCPETNADGSKHRWAWCYGAPCVVDEKDPTKAVCNCPVQTSPSVMIGGNCQRDACEQIWSAETPAAGTFANDKFYAYKKKNYPDRPVNGPPQMCVVKSE